MRNYMNGDKTGCSNCIGLFLPSPPTSAVAVQKAHQQTSA